MSTLRNSFWKKTNEVDVEEVKKIEKLLIEEKNRFEIEFEKYEREVSVLVEENKDIKEEIDKLEKELFQYKKLKEDVKSTLYKAHIDSCTEVYDTGKKFDDMVRYKTRIIKIQQSKNQEIKASINKLILKIKSILSE